MNSYTPGKTITGIIRIISNSDTDKISSMSLDIDIIEHKRISKRDCI